MTPAEFLINDVPDPEAARRFLLQLKEKHPSHERKLCANKALLADVLILVACSPLFATTLLQNPEHIAWLDRERKDVSVREKRALLESLSRFALTHSLLEPHVMLARFRRRELMRIFLKDVRRLAAIAEVTDEISNLADAVLEHALRLLAQELGNRFGQPLETDERGRSKPAEICVVSLGKLGSKELNYSSDIDLLFIYSGNGKTSGTGTSGSISNLEYFSKLTESIVKLVGGQGGEGAAYRVDLRLRPHGRVGPLALSLSDSIRYYESEAAAWERQVLIRTRTSAGSDKIFEHFIEKVKPTVFSKELSVESALRNVARSKQKIDQQHRTNVGIDIKLGSGGIREIEFIAQAMQLAYGGQDAWLRAPHTLVSLDRLAERGHLSGKELTKLFEAYEFLRRLEHILQIENGLQTHLVPNDPKKRSAIAARMNMSAIKLEAELRRHTSSVHEIFERLFNTTNQVTSIDATDPSQIENLEIRETTKSAPDLINTVLESIDRNAPRFSGLAASNDEAVDVLELDLAKLPTRDYFEIFSAALEDAVEFGSQLRALRSTWYRQLIEIVAFDAFGKLSLAECKRAQTSLAEASIRIALQIANTELDRRFGPSTEDVPIAVLALGKLGGGGLDYDSDLDLVFVHGRSNAAPFPVERLNRLVEIFTNVLSSITRDGSLYRVDLRLRPHGNDGPLIISDESFVEYFREDAAIWELLAFVKLRGVGGDTEFAKTVEGEVRTAIHSRALQIDPSELAGETRSIRNRLEEQKVHRKHKQDIDIKFGQGGLLDVYFATRYLQLRYDIRDSGNDRSTLETLRRLADVAEDEPALKEWTESLDLLRNGYEFLATLDHTLRVTVGRSMRLTLGNKRTLESVATSMGSESLARFLEELTLTRMSVRQGFESVLSID